MSIARILVVDDEPQILRFLRPALEASGYDVLHAATGREALRIAANAAPDVIILDLGLPDIDGKEVLTAARQFSQAPILILSARDRRRRRSRRSTSAPTTTSKSPSPSASSSPGCGRPCGTPRARRR